MQHEFLASLAIDPKISRRIEAWGQTVVGGGDDAIIMIKSSSPDFSVGILRTEAGDMGKGHGVLGNAETLL